LPHFDFSDLLLVANNGRELQSVATNVETAVALSPCCQAVMAGCVIGTATDGEVLDEALCLLQPTKTIEAAATMLMVGIFIKRNAA
jgi:hypothetical protein